MDIQTSSLLLISGLAVGASIGCIGVGGVVLVPILVQLMGVPVHQAVPIAMVSYVLAGAAGTWSFARTGTVDWSKAKWLWLGAMPMAIAGSFALKILPELTLKLMIAVLIIFCGLQALRRLPTADHQSSFVLLPSMSLSLGAATGFCSALTGTSGPVTLIPMLLWMRLPTSPAIALALTVQLPIALVASAIYLSRDGIGALVPGVITGLGLCAGTFLGGWIARQLDQLLLKRSVAVVLIGTGIFFIVGLILQNPSWKTA